LLYSPAAYLKLKLEKLPSEIGEAISRAKAQWSSGKTAKESGKNKS
jgi:hypothetical protein